MRGSYLPYLLGVVLASLSCDPGNYDVLPCEPNVENLNQDACNVLNADRKDCTSIYQCDYATKSCKLGPRDYDRDGDPDKACGGTDCNDSDRKISGLNMMCGCSQALLGQTCAVGDGACAANATYTCKDGGLFCTVPNPLPVPDPDYMTKPFTNGSWDWDCDGKTVMKCADKNGALGDCPAKNCDGTMFNVNSSPDQVTAACKAYCSPFSYGNLAADTCTRDKTFFCDQGCGKPIFYCHCAPGSATLTTTSCVGAAMPASTTVRCK